jgi:DNA-binding NtrC family response regulator
MSAKACSSIIALIRQEYVLFSDVMELVRSFLQHVLIATNSRRASICLQRPEYLPGDLQEQFIVTNLNENGELVQEKRAEMCGMCEPFYETPSENRPVMQGPMKEASCAKHHLAPGYGLVITIQYQRRPVGVMALTSGKSHSYSVSDVETATLLTTELAHHMKRYEILWLAQRKIGKDLMLIGSSEAMRTIDKFIEKASQVNLPVLITGELGCDKKNIGYAIHLASRRRDGPLMLINCSTMDSQISPEELSNLFRLANGGTILFHYVDELPTRLQSCFLSLLGSGTGQLISDDAPDVRIITTSNNDLEELAREKRFSQSLLRELDFIHTRIVPLRERKEDIEHIVGYFIKKYGHEQTRGITDEALNLCKQYVWPQNESELKRVIARLAVMSESELITVGEVRDFAPALILDLKTQAVNTRESLSYGPGDSKGAWPNTQPNGKVVQLAKRLGRGECDELQDFHSSVQKALEYLAANFQEKISLHQLASHACVSPSHLSFLFKKSFGISFKTLLTMIRIERAKQLLVEQPSQRVTNISAEVGYDELSHFERTFRRYVYCTPREYRQRL